jgi:glutaredoxin 3
MEWQRYSKVNMPADVTVYVTQTCPYCVAAKQLLNKRGARFVEVDVSGDDEKRAWLAQTTGRRTVPQIFIGGDAIGGYDELAALDRAGKLTEKLAGTQSPSQ